MYEQKGPCNVVLPAHTRNAATTSATYATFWYLHGQVYNNSPVVGFCYGWSEGQNLQAQFTHTQT